MTFDEVDLFIEGTVTDWRRQRDNAYLLYAGLVQNPTSKFDALPLPFDDELINAERSSVVQSADEAIEEYNVYVKYLKDADPLKIRKVS